VVELGLQQTLKIQAVKANNEHKMTLYEIIY